MNKEKSTSVYVFSSPLQYFLCRLIALEYPSRVTKGIQYIELGDFSAVFQQIDNLMGPCPFEMSQFSIGDKLPPENIDRLFLSNRFNQSEIEILLQVGSKAKELCAFEDGLSLYISHNFREASWNDQNTLLVAKNWAKEFVRNHTNFRNKNIRPYYFSTKRYDSFFSIFPDIPGRRENSKLYSIKPVFQSLSDPDQGKFESTAIILSQSLVKDEFISSTDYIEAMIALIRDISTKHAKIIFKAHPRDDTKMIEAIMSQSGCTELPEEYRKVPVELYLAKNRHVTTYGFWSSSLPYAAGGLGMNAFTFAPELVRLGKHSPSLPKTWKSMEQVLIRHGVKKYAVETGA